MSLSLSVTQDTVVVGESDGASEQLARLEERVKEEIGLVKTAEAESRETISSWWSRLISHSTILITFTRRSFHVTPAPGDAQTDLFCVTSGVSPFFKLVVLKMLNIAELVVRYDIHCLFHWVFSDHRTCVHAVVHACECIIRVEHRSWKGCSSLLQMLFS